MKITYLINQYPKISHSFIRREILALEALGLPITRFSIRSCVEQVVDEADKKELEKTRVILGVGRLGLIFNLLATAISRPLAFWSMLFLACRIGWKSEKGILYHLAYLAEACVLLRWLSKWDVTHIHSHFGTNATTVAMFCYGLGGPSYSFTVHGPEEFDKVEAIALPEKIKRAAFVVTISSYSRSQLYRWCEFRDWGKIHIIHCGVDDAFFSLPRQPISEEPCFVCVGRLSEQKGQFLLIKAASKLIAQGHKFKVILVGDGDLRKPIEAAITQENLEDVVEITGWATQAQVQNYILQSRAMVLPSFAEGLPVVMMESLALGRPVISTYVAGIPELVIPGKSGWLVPAGSVEGLVEAMKTALETPVSQLEEMGNFGAKLVAQQHNIMKEAQQLIQLFESVH
ncbi:glycosyltransferase [Crocosphaera sp. UHCC 0190]|uniref:glycosyltransferase n=1 Tax=Crocosphaera sp. UHCC 0190 TaxID=3110246 RepID=UPI002B21DB51|nr:glycosyltransferase [Crocosphaera sp. UHCC 0190]MEA5511641.1 glycosyltransferase [Crocosphaera sp. UHCC 0190]